MLNEKLLWVLKRKVNHTLIGMCVCSTIFCCFFFLHLFSVFGSFQFSFSLLWRNLFFRSLSSECSSKIENFRENCSFTLSLSLALSMVSYALFLICHSGQNRAPNVRHHSSLVCLFVCFFVVRYQLNSIDKSTFGHQKHKSLNKSIMGSRRRRQQKHSILEIVETNER